MGLFKKKGDAGKTAKASKQDKKRGKSTPNKATEEAQEEVVESKQDSKSEIRQQEANQEIVEQEPALPTAQSLKTDIKNQELTLPEPESNLQIQTNTHLMNSEISTIVDGRSSPDKFSIHQSPNKLNDRPELRSDVFTATTAAESQVSVNQRQTLGNRTSLNRPSIETKGLNNSTMHGAERLTFKKENSDIEEEEQFDDDRDVSYQMKHEMKDGRFFKGNMVHVPETNELIPHGYGTMTFPDDSKLEGKWRNGEILDDSTQTYANGDTYKGQFKNQVPHGQGQLKQSDGTIFDGNWVNGTIVTGTEIRQNGEVYNGNFQGMQRHGQGECLLNNQSVHKGLWERGEFMTESINLNQPGNDQGGQGTALDKFADSHYMGYSDIDGKNSKMRFDNNQELTAEEKIERQNQLNDYIWKNENAAEEALDQDEKEFDKIQQEMMPQKEEGALMYDKNGNRLPVVESSACIRGICLQEHADNYKAFYQRYIEDQNNDRWHHDNLLKYLQENPIYCTKYNYTLEKSIMNHYQFEARLEISKDGKQLILHNNKMSTRPTYIYEKFPDDIRAEKKAMKEAQEMGLEYKEPEPLHEFTWQQSSSSCNLEDIQAIMYGGTSSRFWIYRKHMISLDYDVMKFDNQRPGVKTSFPFFAWQCLTLEFETRTVDLVIKDDRQMDILIRFLVQSLDTIDGRRGTSNWYLEASIINEIERRERRNNKKVMKRRARVGELREDEEWDESCTYRYLEEPEKQQIRLDNKKEIYRQTMFKYTLMRIRNKIGYYAFQARMTINELIITQIQRSYVELTKSKQIPPVAPYTDKMIDQFTEMLEAPNCDPMKLLMDLASHPVIYQRKYHIFKQRELRKFGVCSEQELTLEQRVKFQETLESNYGNQEKQRVSERVSRLSQIVEETGRDKYTPAPQAAKKKINQFQNGFGLFDKSSCADIYKSVKVNGTSMYEQRSIRVMIKFKLNQKQIDQQLTKLRFIIGIGELIDVFYLKAVLLKKALVKQRFVLDVEHNLECYIPDELSCDKYPYSFRYYDPVIQITNQLFSKKQKLYHCLKTDFYLKKLQGKDFKKKFLERYGVITTKKNRKQTYIAKLQDAHEKYDVKHIQSKHHISLQKSRYIMVESTEEGLQKLADLQTYVIEKKWEKGPHERTKCLEDEPLELKFCHQGMVNMKRQQFMIFKQTQYTRLDHLKNQGQKFNSVRLVERYVRHNFEDLYKIRPREAMYNPKALERDLDLIPQEQLTDRQKCILDKDRKVYFDWLVTQLESKIMARRAHIRNKCVEKCYKECHKSIPYEERNNWIESRIEISFKYFDQLNDLNQKGNEIVKIKRQVAKVVEKLKEQEAQKLMKKQQKEEEKAQSVHQSEPFGEVVSGASTPCSPIPNPDIPSVSQAFEKTVSEDKSGTVSKSMITPSDNQTASDNKMAFGIDDRKPAMNVGEYGNMAVMG